MSESAAAGHPYYFVAQTDWGDQPESDATSIDTSFVVDLMKISPAGAADLLGDPLVRSLITNPDTHAGNNHTDAILELYGYEGKLATAVHGLLTVTRDGMDLHFQRDIHDPRSADGKNHRRLLRTFEQNKKRHESTGIRKIIPLLLGWSEEKRQQKAQENVQALRDTAIQLLGSTSLARASAQRPAWQEHKLSQVPANDPALMRLLAR